MNKSKSLQIRTTDEFNAQIAALINGTTLRKKSDVIFLAVQELYERRVPPPSSPPPPPPTSTPTTGQGRG